MPERPAEAAPSLALSPVEAEPSVPPHAKAVALPVVVAWLLGAVTLGGYVCYWMVHRQRTLDALKPPKPIGLAVSLAPTFAVIVPVLLTLVGFDAAADLAIALAGPAITVSFLLFSYRLLGILRWRAEQLDQPFDVSAFGWLFFTGLYLQHKMNQLRDLEYRAAAIA